MFNDKNFGMWLHFIKTQEISIEMFGKNSYELDWEQMNALFDKMNSLFEEEVECETTTRNKTRKLKMQKIKLDFLEYCSKSKEKK